MIDPIYFNTPLWNSEHCFLHIKNREQHINNIPMLQLPPAMITSKQTNERHIKLLEKETHIIVCVSLLDRLNNFHKSICQ
jgi:hypothetical protein